MPQFKNKKINQFQINVKPDLSLHRVWPYFVGNRVKFELQIINTESQQDGTIINLFEIFDGEEKVLDRFGSSFINGKWIKRNGFTIDREGDVIYKIGLSSKSVYAETIISAHAINTDTWIPSIIAFLIGLFVPKLIDFLYKLLQR